MLRQSASNKFSEAELEYKRRDGKTVSGNFCIHNPVTFQESAKVCASGIRSFIWTCLKENLAWTLVQLLPLVVSWEISVQIFRPVLCLIHLPGLLYTLWSTDGSKGNKLNVYVNTLTHSHTEWRWKKRTNSASNGVPQWKPHKQKGEVHQRKKLLNDEYFILRPFQNLR